VETNVHFILGCLIYYEIKWRFHCLFKDFRTLAKFFRYLDQKCLALYMQEHFFTILLPSDKGTKRVYRDSKWMWICGTSRCHKWSQRKFDLRSIPGRQTRSSSILQHLNPPRYDLVDNLHLPSGSSSSQQTLLIFFNVIHLASDVRIPNPHTYYLVELLHFPDVDLLSILYLWFTLCITFFYRRLFGSLVLYIHHCTQQSFWPTIWSLVRHKYNYHLI